MEYAIVFALLMGMLFGVVAFNKTGEVYPPIVGGFACILFWVFLNGFTENLLDTEWTWLNPLLWFQAGITAFVAAIVGRNNTYQPATKKKGLLRFIVPAILFLIAIILL